MSRASIALVAIVLLPLASAAVAKAPAASDAPLPKRARKLPDGRYVSPLGFRDTIDYEVKQLTRSGQNFEAGGVQKFKDVAYVRILSKDSGSAWSAIHVVLAEGKTFIYIVASQRQELQQKQRHELSIGDRLTAGRQPLELAI